MLGKNLEERKEFFNAFEVEGDFRPAAEAPLLVPGGCVFLENYGRESLGYRLMCSILVSCRLYVDGRGVSFQGLLCKKCVRKWEINFWLGR